MPYNHSRIAMSRQRHYSLAPGKEFTYTLPVNNSSHRSIATCTTPALSLASMILNAVNHNTVKYNMDGSTDESFFTFLRDTYAEDFCKKYTIDSDSFEVHIRQMMILLKHSQLVTSRDFFFHISPTYKPVLSDITQILFKSFWTKVSWSSFFPSMPSVAEEIYSSRHQLLSILLNMKSSSYLDVIVRKYLKKTGMTSENDLLLISFLDFTVFRWLNFFGCVDYSYNCETLRLRLIPNNTLSILAAALEK